MTTAAEIVALIEKSGQDYEAFRARYDKRQGEIEAAIDDANSKLAALQVGGAGGAYTSTGLKAAFTDVRDFMRAGVRSELTGSTPSDGGYSVPKEVDAHIHDVLTSLSPMRRIARVVQTQTRDYHTLVGARGATTGWVGEEDTRAATASPQMHDIAPPSGEIYAYPSATNWVLEDASFNIETWLHDNVLTEIAIKEGEAFVDGDGSKKPRGFLQYTAADSHPLGQVETVVSGAAAGIKLDGLIDLVYSLPAPYRQAGATWVMNSKSAGEIRKIKDGNGNYIWQPALVAGQPDSILGFPVTIEEAMPDVDAGALPVAFGAFGLGYLITDRTGMKVVRDNVTKPGWTKFYFYRRTGGAVTDANAIKVLRVAAS